MKAKCAKFSSQFKAYVAVEDIREHYTLSELAEAVRSNIIYSPAPVLGQKFVKKQQEILT